MSLTLKFAGLVLPAWLVKGFVLAMSELEKLGQNSECHGLVLRLSSIARTTVFEKWII